MDNDYNIVAQFLDPTEAHLVCGCLVAAGVPAVVCDDQLVQANLLWAPATGGVRVMAPQEFIRKARETLTDYQRGAFTLSEDADVGVPR